MVLVYRVVDLSSELIRQEAGAKLIYVVNRHPEIKMRKLALQWESC
jgi:hypothetical protein